MFKIFVIFSLVAIVCSVPAPPSGNTLQVQPADGPHLPGKSAVEATVKAVNGEIDPKNDKEELESAEFGWGWRNWGWGYPVYRTYYNYPAYYYSSYWW